MEIYCKSLSIQFFFCKSFSKEEGQAAIFFCILAVKKGSEGLGLAFSQLATEVLKRKKAKSIAALIQKGKASEGYFQDKCAGSREYVLLAKEFL